MLSHNEQLSRVKRAREALLSSECKKERAIALLYSAAGGPLVTSSPRTSKWAPNLHHSNPPSPIAQCSPTRAPPARRNLNFQGANNRTYNAAEAGQSNNVFKAGRNNGTFNMPNNGTFNLGNNGSENCSGGVYYTSLPPVDNATYSMNNTYNRPQTVPSSGSDSRNYTNNISVNSKGTKGTNGSHCISSDPDKISNGSTSKGLICPHCNGNISGNIEISLPAKVPQAPNSTTTFLNIQYRGANNSNGHVVCPHCKNQVDFGFQLENDRVKNNPNATFRVVVKPKVGNSTKSLDSKNSNSTSSSNSNTSKSGNNCVSGVSGSSGSSGCSEISCPSCNASISLNLQANLSNSGKGPNATFNITKSDPAGGDIKNLTK